MTPPRLATWLLNRFVAPNNRDSLIGDLAEQYQQGRSRFWYWRQAIVAVAVTCVRDIRDHKLLAARALTVGWLVYWLASFPITWLARITRFWVESALSNAAYYSFWTVFWSGQFGDFTLVYIGCALSGWIVARLRWSR